MEKNELTKIRNSERIALLKELTILAIMLFKFNLMDKTKDIEEIEWYDNMLTFFCSVARSERATSKRIYQEFPSKEAPDVCANCFTILGRTIGGRVRIGCPVCKSCSKTNRDAVIFFEVYSGFSGNQATFYLSQILADLFATNDLN